MFTTAGPDLIYFHAYNDDSAKSNIGLFVSAPPPFLVPPMLPICLLLCPSLAYSPAVELLGMCVMLSPHFPVLHEAFHDNAIVIIRCVCVLHHHVIVCDHLTWSVVVCLILVCPISIAIPLVCVEE